jgi:ABC-type lipoprotein export system ATPase subunit
MYLKNTIRNRIGLMILGPSGSGKSSSLDIYRETVNN